MMYRIKENMSEFEVRVHVPPNPADCLLRISLTFHSAIVNFIKFHLNVFLEAGGIQDYYETRVSVWDGWGVVLVLTAMSLCPPPGSAEGDVR